MSKLLLTAKNNIPAGNGFHIPKGQTFEVHINMIGIQPNNLFNNQRCADQLNHYLEKVYNFPPEVIRRGAAPWKIDMIK